MVEEQPEQLILSTPDGEDVVMDGGMEDYEKVNEINFEKIVDDLVLLASPNEGFDQYSNLFLS